MIGYKKLSKEIKSKISNSNNGSSDIKEIVTLIYNQNIIRTIKYDKLINEITKHTTSNTTIDDSIITLQGKYDKLRSQLETMIKLILELRKTESKARDDIQNDIIKINNELIKVRDDYKVLLIIYSICYYYSSSYSIVLLLLLPLL